MSTQSVLADEFDLQYIAIIRKLLLTFNGQVDCPDFDKELTRETEQLWELFLLHYPLVSVRDVDTDDRSDCSGVYRLVRTTTRQPLYVGQTICLRKRLMQHGRNKFRQDIDNISYQFVPTAFSEGVEAILLSEDAFRAKHPENDKCEDANHRAFKAQIKMFFYDPEFMTLMLDSVQYVSTFALVSQLFYRSVSGIVSVTKSAYQWAWNQPWGDRWSAVLKKMQWKRNRYNQLAITWPSGSGGYLLDGDSQAADGLM
jgi:hypothetical protein